MILVYIVVINIFIITKAIFIDYYMVESLFELGKFNSF